MITLHCTCGETFQADDAHVGKTLRCRCGRILKIAPAVPASAPFQGPASRDSHAVDPKTAHAREPRPAGHRARLPLAASASIALLFVAWVLTRPETPTPTSAVVADDPYQPAEGEAFRLDDLLDSAGPVAPQPPPCPAEGVFRPRSSKELGGRHRGGLGRLQVVNGTDFDAVAVLVESSTNLPRRAIYIRRSETGVLTEIPRGTYQLRFQLGTSWHVNRYFCRVAGTSEFDRPVDFEEREKSDSIEYSTFKITLHPVPLGTATTHSILASAFELPPL